MRNIAVAALVAGVLAGGSAHAGFLYVDTQAPAAGTLAVPASNDFRAQLNSAGVTTETFGASLSLTGPGSVSIDYFGKEAMYTNTFMWNGAVVGTTPTSPAVDPWQARNLGTFAASGGLLNFAFCTSGGPGMGAAIAPVCVTNADEDARALSAVNGITMFIGADTNVAWLMWDDGGGGPDDNHDDMIVRLTYRVPEPGTLALLGLGLLATGAAARRRKQA